MFASVVKGVETHTRRAVGIIQKSLPFQPHLARSLFTKSPIPCSKCVSMKKRLKKYVD